MALTNPDSVLYRSGPPDPAPYLGKIIIRDRPWASAEITSNILRWMGYPIPISWTRIPSSPPGITGQVCVLTTGKAGGAAAADYLSTALFCLPLEQSRALAESLEGVECLWVLSDGQTAATAGFPLLPMDGDVGG